MPASGQSGPKADVRVESDLAAAAPPRNAIKFRRFMSTYSLRTPFALPQASTLERAADLAEALVDVSDGSNAAFQFSANADLCPLLVQ